MFDIVFTNHFKKQLKKLKKKYIHVKDDLILALEDFSEENCINIRKNVYKIRIASRDMHKGKSGGFRCYIYIIRSEDILAPLCIYAKSSKENLSWEELTYHIQMAHYDLKILLS